MGALGDYLVESLVLKGEAAVPITDSETEVLATFRATLWQHLDSAIMELDRTIASVAI